MKKLKIVKIPGFSTCEELESFRNKFENDLFFRNKFENDLLSGNKTDSIIEEIELNTSGDYITMVKVGNENYQSTLNELEEWRRVFEEASKDKEPYFTIFTYKDVTVEQFKKTDYYVVAGEYVLVKPNCSCKKNEI